MRQTASLPSRTLLIAPTEPLIHLALHAARDGIPFALTLTDLRYVLLDKDLDWDRVARFVTEEGWQTIVYDTLAYAQAAIGARCVGPPTDDRIRSAVLNRLYPAQRRLVGHEALANNRRRELLLPLTIPGQGRLFLRRLLRRAVPAREILAEQRPKDRGPFLWRAARYRIGQQLELRRRRNQEGPPPMPDLIALAPPGGPAFVAHEAALQWTDMVDGSRSPSVQSPIRAARSWRARASEQTTIQTNRRIR